MSSNEKKTDAIPLGDDNSVNRETTQTNVNEQGQTAGQENPRKLPEPRPDRLTKNPAFSVLEDAQSLRRSKKSLLPLVRSLRPHKRRPSPPKIRKRSQRPMQMFPRARAKDGAATGKIR